MAAASMNSTVFRASLFSPNLKSLKSFLPLNPLKPHHFPKSSLHTISKPKPKPTPKSSSSDLPNPLSRTLKSRLASNDPLYGLFIFTFCPTLSEIAGLAGYDFVVLDMEHGPGGITDSLNCLRSLASTNTPVILRVPEISPAWAKKALDIGPQGIMFPAVESVEDAKRAVEYCRYPPRGVRGSAHSVVRASGYGFDEAYLSHCEEDLLIICQAETVTSLKQVEAIASVEGVDVVQMGPTDLSASMGYLWDPGHKKVRETLKDAERRILSLKREGGAYLAGFAMPHDPPEQLKLRGYHMVSGAVDIGLFKKAVVEDVKRFRDAGIGGEDEEEDEGGKDGYYSE